MRYGPWAVLIVVGVCAATPCVAQVIGEVTPAQFDSASGTTFTIGIDLQMVNVDDTLGSYGATLMWDTAVLSYVSDTGGGDAPFDTAVVNRTGVGVGFLNFSDASALGAVGRVNVLNVTFEPVVAPPATTVFDLEFTSLFNADTLQDLMPILTVEDGGTCVSDFAFNVKGAGGTSTTLSWDAITQAADYDAIRGNVNQLVDDGVSVRLGDVVCIENDSLDTTTAEGTEIASADDVIPLLGKAFFYLVRFNDGFANSTYGFSAACTRERVVDSGDCP